MNGSLTVVQCWHCRRFFDDAQGWLDHTCSSVKPSSASLDYPAAGASQELQPRGFSPVAALVRGAGRSDPAPGLPTFDK